jgi:hypothetical protein
MAMQHTQQEDNDEQEHQAADHDANNGSNWQRQVIF